MDEEIAATLPRTRLKVEALRWKRVPMPASQRPAYNRAIRLLGLYLFDGGVDPAKIPPEMKQDDAELDFM
jgi:hypothetical protein